MQLLNSKILSDSKNTRYSNKKSTRYVGNLCFLCVVAFSYYKDGGGAETCTPVLNAPIKPSTYLSCVYSRKRHARRQALPYT